MSLGIIILVVVTVVAGLAAMFAGVHFLNRAIGGHFEAQGQRMLPLLEREGLRFVEEDVAVRIRALAFFGFSVRWVRADIRVTARALYVFQFVNNLGRMAQPILEITEGGAHPHHGTTYWYPLARPPRREGGSVILDCRRSFVSTRIRLRPRDIDGLMRALGQA